MVSTVTHFNYQDAVLKTFQSLNALTKRSTLFSVWGSFGFAITQGVLYWQESLMYIAAGRAILDRDSSTAEAFGVFNSVLCAVSLIDPPLWYERLD